ncbi:MAG: energy transducer TonB, partial [Kiritimatiellia bacterium]|nr:energy transducer TonB [Kiritimatiellia bacterium]
DFVFELSQVDTPPQPVAQVPPLYPVTARMKGIEGEVTLVCIVRPDGSTDNVQVSSSEPKGGFDASAINAVKNWRFKPATSGGAPVACRVILPLKIEVEE